MSPRLRCTTLSSHRQLSDVAEGLNFLHSCNITHGGLKGVRDHTRSHFTTILTSSQPNILIDTTSRARITDFGLAMVTQNLDLIRSASAEYGHSARWIAPEILNGRGTYSKEADVFSFAMVTIEVRSGQLTRDWRLINSHSFEQRLLLVLFRLVTNHLSRLCWRLWVASVRHGRPTRL